VEAGATVNVHLLGRDLEPADLVVIGSHCVGLDYLLSQLSQRGYRAKFLAVGSTAGLEAARRGECDLAGIHLLDPKSGEYNQPFLTEDLELIRGYGRMQGVLFRRGDARFEGCSAADAIEAVKSAAACRMVNRNAGSGTRILIDRILGGTRPAGYSYQVRNHQAAAAAVAQQRADWGVAIQSVAESQRLGFLPLQAEQYDFIVPQSRLEQPAMVAFRELLKLPQVLERLAALKLVIGRASQQQDSRPAR
jgi:putative molybdopterin biosynthesis protein